MIYHPTAIEDYLRCPRKFFYKNVHIIEDLADNVDLVFGRAVHAGVAAFYKVRKAERTLCPMVQAFRAEWKEDFVGSDKKNLMTGLATIENYFKEYKEDTMEFNPSYIEVTQPIEMLNGTIMQGTLDRLSISLTSNYVMITDTKTTSMPLTDYWFRTFENSFQLGAYFYITVSILGHCDAVQIDGIRVPQKGKEDFSRRSWPRTEVQQKEWMNTYLDCTNKIEEAKDDIKKYPCNPTSCGDYSGCPFLSLCTLGREI